MPLGENDIQSNALSAKSIGADLISAIGNRSDRIHGILSVEKIVNCVAGGRLELSDDDASDE